MTPLKTTLACAAMVITGSTMADTIKPDLLGFTTAAQKVMNETTAQANEVVKNYNLDANTLGCHFDSVIAIHTALRSEDTTEKDIVAITSKHNKCITNQLTIAAF
ncbi:MAG: hypothetical protein ACPG05_03910 [Bdellovibrionales bacterium]